MDGAHLWKPRCSLTRGSPHPILHLSVVLKEQGGDDDDGVKEGGMVDKIQVGARS